jgi:hypothetical protein
MAGVKAFREAFVSAETLDPDEFNDFGARQTRYEIFWSMYENTVYREIHKWARTYKTKYGLYRYIRNIYNPAYRLGEFWKTHLWGGTLDLETKEGSLPIVTENDALRLALTQLWRWSNWYVRKDIATLYGAVMGDVFLRVVDDVQREKVYLDVLHPGTVSDVTVDPFGNIKAYLIEETRKHPADPKQSVTYKETAERGEGDAVVYRTYLDGTPYPWNGVAEEWEEPYGFIPMVHIQHNDVGLDWGWSEFHPARSKMHELDDVASILSDQIRKTTNVKWLFTGVKAGSTSPTPTGETTETTSKPEPGREEEPALYASNPDAKALPLVAELNIAGTVEHIVGILKDLERDYPELKFDALRAAGDVSGKALRVARQPAEAKVNQRRAIYDDALVRAQQMATAIGGFRGYDGFSGFGLESYTAGDLDHQIGDRPVFAVDTLDELEESKLFWETAEVAKKAGVPLDGYLKDAGWDDERIRVLTDSPEYQARLALMNMAMLGQGPGQNRGDGTRTGDQGSSTDG